MGLLQETYPGPALPLHPPLPKHKAATLQSCMERATSPAKSPQQWLQFVATQPAAGGEATAELGNSDTEASKLNAIPNSNASAGQRPA